MAYPTKFDNLRTIKILEVQKESNITRTLRFKDQYCGFATPGQFAMVWIPGNHEAPMSLSEMNGNGSASITVKDVGPGSHLLYRKKPGEVIGIRGPYGNGFSQKGSSVLLVGGGTGLAPLMPLAENFCKKNVEINLVMAASSEKTLPFLSRANNLSKNYNLKTYFVTQDGSLGHKGIATDILPRILSSNSFDAVYTCGPELMMRKVFEAADSCGIFVEACIERFMKCAVGICGACSIGKYLVCKDGPVFNLDNLKEVIDEFGIKRRNHLGRLTSF